MATLFAAPRAPTAVAQWLAGRSRSERRIVVALLVLAAATLLWAALWQPLTRDTAAMRAARAADSARLAVARRLSEEIAGLARTAGTQAAPDTRAGLDRILAQQNLRPAITQLAWQDGRARVVFAAVGFDALIVALEALQRDAQLRAAEATITARVEPGMVRAELTLTR